MLLNTVLRVLGGGRSHYRMCAGVQVCRIAGVKMKMRSVCVCMCVRVCVCMCVCTCMRACVLYACV